MPNYKRRKTLLTLTTSYDDCKINVPKNEYLKITEGYMKFLADKVLDGIDVQLPYNVGTVRVRGNKMNTSIQGTTIKGSYVDWNKTKELWRNNPEAKEKKVRIFMLNEHSNGIIYGIKWFTSDTIIRNKNSLEFIPTRKNKRRLNKQIMNNKEYIIDNKEFIVEREMQAKKIKKT
jgi:hypothetical protein